MKKICLLALLLSFFLQGCEKTDLEGLSDNKLLELAYDRTYFYPDGFYQELDTLFTPYYLNTNNIYPWNEHTSTWIELSTDDKNDVIKWFNLAYNNSSDVEVNEKEKYFEIKSVEFTYFANRVHKKSYYHSIFDRWQPWNHINETKYGYYNAEIEKNRIKECIEYLWVQNTFANFGQKVLNSTIKEKSDYLEVHIVSLSMTYGDWDMRDVLKVYDNYIRFNKKSRLISFKQSLKKEIFGEQR